MSKASPTRSSGSRLFKSHVKTEPTSTRPSVARRAGRCGDVDRHRHRAGRTSRIHEAVASAGDADHDGQHPARAIDYKQIPGRTYTHPQVASMGLHGKEGPRGRLRRSRSASSPSAASGRALAAGETDGFVKLIFDKEVRRTARRAHDRRDRSPNCSSELVLARKLEATEQEILKPCTRTRRSAKR